MRKVTFLSRPAALMLFALWCCCAAGLGCRGGAAVTGPEAVEQALTLGEGNLIVAVEHEKPQRHKTKESTEETAEYEDIVLSAHYACTYCGSWYVDRRLPGGTRAQPSFSPTSLM